MREAVYAIRFFFKCDPRCWLISLIDKSRLTIVGFFSENKTHCLTNTLLKSKNYTYNVCSCLKLLNTISAILVNLL